MKSKIKWLKNGAKQAKQSTLNHVHPVINRWVGRLKEHKDFVKLLKTILDILDMSTTAYPSFAFWYKNCIELYYFPRDGISKICTTIYQCYMIWKNFHLKPVNVIYTAQAFSENYIKVQTKPQKSYLLKQNRGIWANVNHLYTCNVF